MNYSTEEMAEMILIYGEARCNAREASPLYRDRFPNINIPDPRTFAALYGRFRNRINFAKES